MESNRLYLYYAPSQEEELALLRKEICGRKLRISFDETTIRSVVLCVIVAFVDGNGKMQQRVFKVGLYKESPDEKLTNQMNDHIIHAIETTLNVPRDLIKVFTRDGVALNDFCMKNLIGGEVQNPNDRDHVIQIKGLYEKTFNIMHVAYTR